MRKTFLKGYFIVSLLLINAFPSVLGAQEDSAGHNISVDGLRFSIPSDLAFSADSYLKTGSVSFEKFERENWDSISIHRVDEFNSIVENDIYKITELKHCNEVKINLVRLKDGEPTGVNETYLVLTKSALIMLFIDDEDYLKWLFDDLCRQAKRQPEEHSAMIDRELSSF